MEKANERLIYLAGGCFWGMQRLMQSLPGVSETTVGYANGRPGAEANYKAVCAGDTGFRETVKVSYDPSVITLDAVLFAYFAVIDPTVRDQQAHDVGSQYQTGIYYVDVDAQATIERIVAIERRRYDRFYVEVKPLENFYPAETYHQDYLIKNPQGYCHIDPQQIAMISRMVVDPGRYVRPDDEAIHSRLTELQYQVTQRNATEAPYDNAYNRNEAPGIYVDIVTGEPLFSSADKYRSSCGWPSFDRPLDANAVIYKRDTSHGMERTEVRSRSGDSHLGHRFSADAESPTGIRYCMNSAALRFIPLADMKATGYGYLIDKVKDDEK